MEVLGSHLSALSPLGESPLVTPLGVEAPIVPVQGELETEPIATSVAPNANSLTLPFWVDLEQYEPVQEGPVRAETALDALPVKNVETLADYAGNISLFDAPQIAAFDPMHDEPMPDRAPQLLQHIMSNPFATIPSNPGATVQEQAYTAFVQNLPLITTDMMAQSASDPNHTYAKLTEPMDTFQALYEAHKNLV